MLTFDDEGFLLFMQQEPQDQRPSLSTFFFLEFLMLFDIKLLSSPF